MRQAAVKHVAVVVLGDIGRSPRMQYHAFSLAREGARVDVIGYRRTPAFPEIAAHPGIRWRYMREGLQSQRGSHQLWIMIAGLGKAWWDCIQLLWFLAAGRPDVILAQNPPAIPTLPAVWVAAFVCRARLVIDWHNFGHSMAALRLSPRHPAVKLIGLSERVFGALASAHLCVSTAMKQKLLQDWNIDAVVLYDRPPDWFRPVAASERSGILDKLVCSRGNKKRGPVLVSPSSWTADEDHTLLLDGLRRWDAALANRRDPDNVVPLVLLTGRGRLRAYFEAEIASMALRKVDIRTLWLEGDDYALLLGAADAGICVHRSASGVDLPMKISDMFGSGLPVLAFDYGPCLRELVQPGVNGFCFDSAEELARLLEQLRQPAVLEKLRSNVESFERRRWDEEWKVAAKPVILS